MILLSERASADLRHVSSGNSRFRGSPESAVLVASPRVVKKPNDGGVRHALDVFDSDQSGFSSGIDDLFGQPLKALVMDRFVWKHVGGGFELDSAKLLKPAPDLYPLTGVLGR